MFINKSSESHSAATSISFSCPGCIRSFTTWDKLGYHQRASVHCQVGTDVGLAAADECEESEVVAEDTSNTEECLVESEVSKIQSEFLDQCSQLQFEHYLTPSNVQRHKAAAQAVANLQTKAIKRALKGKVLPDTNLDSIIDTIMDATTPFHSLRAEAKTQANRLAPYPVLPRRRNLGTHQGTRGYPLLQY